MDGIRASLPDRAVARSGPCRVRRRISLNVTHRTEDDLPWPSATASPLRPPAPQQARASTRPFGWTKCLTASVGSRSPTARKARSR